MLRKKKSSLKASISERLSLSPSSVIGFRRISCLLVIVLLCSLTNDAADLDFEFCYDQQQCGPSAWPDLCQKGTTQSPINLESSKVTKIAKSVSLVLSREYGLRHTFLLENNGRTVKLYLNREKTSNCLIKGTGFLPQEPYYFYQLHFHWGVNEFVGSEHTINGRSFPLELHMIHRRASDDSKFAVLGIMFRLSEQDNPALTPILNNLYLVQDQAAGLVDVPSSSTINLSELLPKKVKFFRYGGSLTTPPCSEGIIWTVFDDYSQTVSKSQLNEFRKLFGYDGRPIQTNYRPIQKTFTTKRKQVFYMKNTIPRTTKARKRKIKIG